MSFLAGVQRVHGVLVRALELVLVALFVLLTLDVLWGVFSRYVLGAQSRWTEELAIYSLVWISLLGASVTYGENGHLGVDYFANKLEPSARRVAAISVEILVGFFAAFALVYGGWVLVTKTLESGQVAPSLNIKTGYLYLAVPISGVFFLTFCIEHLARLFAGEPPPSESAETIVDV